MDLVATESGRLSLDFFVVVNVFANCITSLMEWRLGASTGSMTFSEGTDLSCLNVCKFFLLTKVEVAFEYIGIAYSLEKSRLFRKKNAC